MDGLLFILTFLAALGSGAIGGLFFAFSAFVMTALGRLPPAGGISAMQSIRRGLEAAFSRNLSDFFASRLRSLRS